MPDRLKETDWLAKVPLWFKAGVGFMGTIATIVGFIVAWRENAPLFTLVTLALLLGGLFLVSLYVFIARRSTKSKKMPGTYRYPKFRALGLIGMMIVCLVLAAPYFVKPVGEFTLNALLGTQIPTATLTPSATLTPVPSSTPSPRPTPIPTSTPPQLAAADVVVARFQPLDTNFVQNFEPELEAQLQADLRANGLPDVSVRLRNDLLIANEEEAQDAANRTGSKVIIWGQFSPHFIQVRVFLSGGDRAGTEVPGTKQVGLTNSDPSAGLAFQVPGVIAENLRFLAPFVLGHLHYHSNNYAAGHVAFDSAMANIPCQCCRRK